MCSPFCPCISAKCRNEQEYRQQENTLNMRDPPQGPSPKILLECKAGCGSGLGARWLYDELVSSNISSCFEFPN
ncbi:hypothetical protein XENOCAPTIV_004768 [Xenoophorus captivus]|uniref:Uncharacterized protein n=1 Tax=Xenoophorus captivus TaxID=1517983 RepID=A0ABV0Q4D5_9TELE